MYLYFSRSYVLKMRQLLLIVASALVLVARGEEEVGEGEGSYKIEGKITPPDVRSHAWFTDVTIVIDGGKRRAFLRDDNSFVFQASIDHK